LPVGGRQTAFALEPSHQESRNVEEINAGDDSRVDEREFYRKRAMDEVSSLQMVEHVLSGIEREHMKMTPVTFDDLAVKKALHKFLQVTGDFKSEEHGNSENALMQETENWSLALGKRDGNVSVANIRRFCENSRPVLSSQALMALARFYRNSSYSEPVRGKFDFVMTRLFSRDIGEERRKLLFGRTEMVGHIKTFYANWSSIALYTADDGEPGIAEAVSRFDAFVREAENAESFDVLITGDFFNRIRLFKEETNEMFFVADVAAAAIECNVRIGNRYVDLIRAERESNNVEKIEEKYGYSYDTIISNAASKTLLLVELLKDEQLAGFEKPAALEEVETKTVERRSYERAPVETAERSGFFDLFSVNKYLAAFTVLVVALSAGVYLWSENFAGDAPTEVARDVDLGDSPLKQHIRTVRSSSETLYGVTQPTWDSMSADEQK